MLDIQTDEGNNTIIYVPAANCGQIELLEQSQITLPGQQKGRKINPPSELLNLLFPGTANEYIFQTRIDGIIVGSFNILKQEAQTSLAIFTQEGKKYQGFLYDLFRVKGFNPASSGHRFFLQSATSNEPIVLPDDTNPYSLVIFDGALSFSKWKESYLNQNWLVILNHTEPSFQNAVNQINQAYIYRSNVGLNLSVPPIPSGMEIMLFARDL